MNNVHLLLLEKVMRAFSSLTQHTSVMVVPLEVLLPPQASQLLEVTNQMNVNKVIQFPSPSFHCHSSSMLKKLDELI